MELESLVPQKPSWLRARMSTGNRFLNTLALKKEGAVNTVCEEAMCPNIYECWDKGTATFLILGPICTRNCQFCAIQKGRPAKVDDTEPIRVAETVSKMDLEYIVITSVTRDDLEDGGATIFQETVSEIKKDSANRKVEVLIPDFLGKISSLLLLMEADISVLNHNIETVKRLYGQVRPGADYHRSLKLLESVKEIKPDLLTKSGIMVGIGETFDEIIELLKDLRRVGCDMLTIGQYLSPSRHHVRVQRYYLPEEFNRLKDIGYELGFLWVESGPLVRSSYRAREAYHRLINGDK